jgi:hypothetical protein
MPKRQVRSHVIYQRELDGGASLSTELNCPASRVAWKTSSSAPEEKVSITHPGTRCTAPSACA